VLTICAFTVGQPAIWDGAAASTRRLHGPRALAMTDRIDAHREEASRCDASDARRVGEDATYSARKASRA
jgi:hypothetical protein